MYELPSFSFLAVYFVSLQIINCNSRSSTHWKLRVEDGKVLSNGLSLGSQPKIADDVENNRIENNIIKDNNKRNYHSNHIESSENDLHHNRPIEDTVFDILATTLLRNGKWIRDGKPVDEEPLKNEEKPPIKSTKYHKSSISCGSEANFTEYDHLAGISKRHSHPELAEPDVLNLFKEKQKSSTEVNINTLERQLKKSILEKPENRDILNDVGNFLRIKGDTQGSIECFRKILRQFPSDSEALLNLGRVLFHLGYLEDAAFLTRKSLEMEQPLPTAHLHHFTLGEILKAYGHYYEASLYFKQALILKPDYQPAKDYLKELRSFPESRVHAYTLFIIVFLVMAVLLGVLSTFEAVRGHGCEGLCGCNNVEAIKTQRHFNRAMAMRSMKMAVNSRPFRFRK